MSKKFLYVLVCFAWIPLLVALIYQNSSPFGDTIKFRHNLTSDQKWAEKMVKNGEGPVVLKNELSSFLLKVPEGYRSLNISAKFKNNANDTFQMAVKTNLGTIKRNILSLDYKPLNNFPWSYIKEGKTTLYQKYKNYETLQEFFDYPPLGSIIAFYEFSDLDKIKRKPTVLPDYEPNEELQEINHVLRGSHTLYVYIKDEDLYFEFEKQDINWVEGEDVLTIDVSNAQSLFTRTVPDDGIVNDPGRVENVQKIKIHIPNLPEGVYKIILKQPGGDALIKNIKTHQHKLVFANNIYLADSELYEGILPKPTTIYSKGVRLTAMSREEFSAQALIINDESELILDKAGKSYSRDLPLGLHKIFIPRSNIQLTDSYFAFSEEAYFEPFNPSLYPYNSKMNLESFDYLITTYVPPVEDNGWLVNHQTFDLTKIETVDRVVPVSLIIPEIWRTGNNEERVTVAYLDMELVKLAPKNPGLVDQIMAFFPKLIGRAIAIEPDKRISWLIDQFSLKKILSFFQFQAKATVGQ